MSTGRAAVRNESTVAWIENLLEKEIENGRELPERSAQGAGQHQAGFAYRRRAEKGGVAAEAAGDGRLQQRAGPRALAEREKVSINKNNFNAVLGDFNPRAKIAVENTLAADGSELPVDLDFHSMDDFKPEVVAGKVPELRALMAARNLLRDLKSNLLDNAMFRRELEKIPQGPGAVRTPARRSAEDRPQAAPAPASAQ